MERDKLGREVKGKWDGTDSWEESHELKMDINDEYRATKERANGKWRNIISHMDALWHSPLGPDGCSKCTMYEDILYEAFERIDSLSGRTITDLATIHRDDMLLGDEDAKLALNRARDEIEYHSRHAENFKKQLDEVIDDRRRYMSAQKEHEERINAFMEHEKKLDDAYFDLRVEHAIEKKELEAEIKRLNQKLFTVAVKKVKGGLKS